MFDFENNYPQWRESRLATVTTQQAGEARLIKNPYDLSQAEVDSLKQDCEHNNFALYRLADQHISEKSAIRALATRCGMLQLDQHLCADNDSMTSLQVMRSGPAQGYIPYTERALNWHTDGYYNASHQQIRSFLLHCVQNAPSGGENMLINHDLIYIQLQDTDPALITALRQPDALTIPPNIDQGKQVRAAQTGPVFFRDPLSQRLCMRYTARSRNIQWKQDPTLLKAVSMIEELLCDNPYTLRLTLQAGEGLLCNNILHGRSAFTNGNIPAQQRLMYRARSYDRLFSH